MKGYHDKKTFREWIASPFYHIPELPKPFEEFLAGNLIPFIEGENPHWRHLGKKCPCMTKKDISEEK